MKNKEFYKEEILDIVIQGYNIALIEGKPVACKGGLCRDCAWFVLNNNDCLDGLRKWAEEEYAEPENNSFDIKPKDVFYYVDYDGNIERSYFRANSTLDIQILKFGNACKDEEYMEKRAREIRLYNLLSNFAYQVNEGWEPDWSDADQNKWFVYRAHQSHRWEVTYYNQAQCMNDVYFKTQELAQRAIDDIILPFERGEL